MEMKDIFVGRSRELAALARLREKSGASLFVCKGRRRIGKSRLVFEFARGFRRFLEFQGLPPRKGQDNIAQLANFASQLARQTSLPQLTLTDWSQAFELLAAQIRREPTLILLDEVSWMGRYDPDFAGKLKIAWDTQFSRQERLIVGLCGSVSTWIEDNILNNTNFLGRITSTIALGELPLADCGQFWHRTGDRSGHIAPFEKLKLLGVTGGVPRYLEELDPRRGAEDNINQLCFQPEGFLFDEMDRIFDDSFDKERAVYRQLVEALQDGHADFSDLAARLQMKPGGTLSKYLGHLEQSSFVRRDTVWRLDGKPAKSARFRLSDNYLRFYQRCIKPHQAKIKQGLGAVVLDHLPAWRAILGLQFENLVLNNLGAVIGHLGLDATDVVSVGPYIQRASSKNKGGCQIDLLVHSRFDCLYVCELKMTRRVDMTATHAVQEKIRRLKRPKYFSVRPVLVYAGELDDEVLASGSFYRTFDVGSLL